MASVHSTCTWKLKKIAYSYKIFSVFLTQKGYRTKDNQKSKLQIKKHADYITQVLEESTYILPTLSLNATLVFTRLQKTAERCFYRLVHAQDKSSTLTI